MELKRQDLEEFLFFFKNYLGDDDFLLNPKQIKVKNNLSSYFEKVNNNMYLLYKISFPDDFSTIYRHYDKNSLLNKITYTLIFNKKKYILTLNYSQATFFEKDYMLKFDKKNLKNLGNIFDFILLPKSLILADENNKIIFKTELKIFVSLGEIIESLEVFINKKEIVEEVTSNLFKIEEKIYEPNKTSMLDLKFENFSPMHQMDVQSLPKGVFIFEDFVVVVKEKEKNIFLRYEDISIKRSFTVKYFYFTTNDGFKRTCKIYSAKLY